jgi:transcriptional regulator with AAA-type ATPase domain
VNTQTLSQTGEGAGPAPGPGAYLVLATDCSRPLAPSWRFSLGEVDEVVVGRGATCRAVRAPADGRVRLRIDVADPWMSAEHFRLTRAGSGTWVLTDAGSKNGTMRNGVRRPGGELADGDVIDGGRTLFVFRDRPLGPSGPRDVCATPEGRAGLTTLSTDLAAHLDVLARIARSNVSVLLGGETGVGKEVVARALHELSGRGGPFVAVNCGALPATLVEAELFGAERGAFTGSVERRDGLVRASSGGTLFLDEIAELPEPSQATLLRVLQEREVLPIGATRPVPVDLRVVAASHRDLGQRADAGSFRHDLLARLRGFELALPPLRERREDLGLLIASLLRRLAGERAERIELQLGAARALFLHAWPYNVRELAQALEAALAVAGDRAIELADLPRALREPSAPPGAPAPGPAAPAAQDPRAALEAALRRHEGNITAVARALGTSRSQVRRLAERFGIDLATFRR